MEDCDIMKKTTFASMEKMPDMYGLSQKHSMIPFI